MKKKDLLILCIFMFSIFLIPISLATYQDDVIDCFSYESDGNGDDGILEGSLTNGASIDNSVYKLGSGSLLLDGTNDYVDITNEELKFGDTTDFSICAWINSDSADTMMILDTREDGSDPNAGWRWYVGTDGASPVDRRIRVQINDNSTDLMTYNGVTYPDYNDWFFLCFTADRDGNICHYNNGAVNGSCIDISSIGNVNTDVMHLGIRSFGVDAVQFDGNIDEMVIYDSVKTAQDISDLYNSNTGKTCADILGGSPTPSLTVNTNLVNGTENYNYEFLEIYYNGTFTNENTDLANCTIFIDELAIYNDTDVNLTFTNTFHNYTLGTTSGWYNISINCTNFEVSDKTDYFKYNVDTTQPYIFSDFVNNTVFNDSDTFRFYVNFTDDNLDGYEINFTDTNGNLWLDTVFTENLSITFTENITEETLNSLDIGNYTIDVTSWDSHNPTDKIHEKFSKLEDKKIYFGDSWLNIQDDNIKEYSIKSDDNKYKEKIKFYDLFGTMVISSNKPIRIINSNHKAHIISRYLGKYRDLDSEDITILNTYQYDLYTIIINYELEKTNVDFSSIGDLNINTISYSFSIVEESSLSDSYLLAILEQEELQTADIDNINEVLKLIPFLIIYSIFLIFGYHLITTGNIIPGFLMNLTTVFMDFYLIQYFYAEFIRGNIVNSWNTAFIGFLSVGLLFWLFSKVSYPFLLKQNKKALNL